MIEINDAFWQTLAIFAGVGFIAQIIDGALGMAYGVTCSTVLMAFGVPPVNASAAVHVAETFTTGASAISHISHKNVDWKAFFPLMIGGVLGGSMGAFVLTQIDGKTIKPFIVAYLGIMGCVILWRAWQGTSHGKINWKWAGPLGLVGGFMDASGGGGWGPTVTSSLVGGGAAPRQAIGTTNTAEFFVTAAISATFVWALVSGNWTGTGDLWDNLPAVIGLVLGGLVAAPLAGYVVKIVPPNRLIWAVGFMVVGLSIYQGVRLFS